jgi:hypothetical protein
MTDASTRGRQNKNRGKDVERQVAQLVGGQRIPDGVGHGDVQNDGTVFEVKSRRAATPKLISGAWAQAERAAVLTGKDPSVVLAYTPGRGRPREFWILTKLEPE